MSRSSHADHHHSHQQSVGLTPPASDLIRVGSRRWFLQTGVSAVAGLSVAEILRRQAAAGTAPSPNSLSEPKRSVILFWLSGGPSHLDMWDPKPGAPLEVRGPYQTIPTAIPGVHFSEHLPLQAAIADKLAVLRSVDCSASNHTPITMQAGNPLARRTNDGRDGGGYPSMGSIAAKFRGPNNPEMPAFVGLAKSWKADVWGAGHMGNPYEPIKGHELPGRLKLPEQLAVDRLQNRDVLRRDFDRLRRDLDRRPMMDRFDRYEQMAYDMVTSGRVQQAFDIGREPDALRDEYGRESIGEKALLARRLVEAGVTFTLVSGAWGYFDHHGDDVRWGGIERGLTPLLPRIDRAMATLVRDLDDRGLLDSTLVLMLGEFGRTPVINKQAGRGHWTNCMSMLAAGGGIRAGQVIGATDRKGYAIAERPIGPSDLAATVFTHLGIDTGAHWTNGQGRPIPIVTEGGQPIRELLG